MFSTLGRNNLSGTNALAYYEKGPSVMKLFTAVIGVFLYIVFVPGRPLEPSLIFVGKYKSLPSRGHQE